MFKLICLGFTLLFMQACKHPLAIEGEGDIVERLSGERGCSLVEFQTKSERCTDNLVFGEPYRVRYEGVAREGWRFYRWSGTFCAANSETPFCDYDLRQETVDAVNTANPDATFLATTAVFIQHPPIDIVVPSTAIGGFGPLLGGLAASGDAGAMIVAAVLLANETITITATGAIDIATGNDSQFVVTPEGIDLSIGERPGGLFYFPLEEAAVDAGDLPIPIPFDPAFGADNVGGLMGAFVPQSAVVKNNFIPKNDDPDPNKGNFAGNIAADSNSGGIPAESLFFIGSGPTQFQAPEDGVLFLGINDANSTNNDDGTFVVSISAD